MSDKFTVDIKDFQSVKSASLDFPTGLTIITGKTNNGKTALFRAIDSALFNKGDDSMIRAGKRYSGVSIDNGKHKMVFMRDSVGKNEKTAYQFDGGTVQKKVGRNQLPEVSEYFNIRDVRMQNGTKMKINFWYQNDKPFLMDKTSGQLYEFLSLSSCDKYTRVLKIMLGDSKVLEAEINNITTEIDTLKTINNKKKEFIDKNKGFDDVYLKAVTLSQREKEIEEESKYISEIDLVSDRIKVVNNSLNKVKNRIDGLPIDYLNGHMSDVNDKYSKCVSLVSSINTVIKTFEVIKNKEEIVNDISIKSNILESVIDPLKGRIIISEREKKRLSDLETLISDSIKISDSISSIEAHLSSFKYFDSLEETSKKIDMIKDESQKFDLLSSSLDEIESLSNLIHNMEFSLSNTYRKIEENKRDMEELKKQAGYCPYCGTVFEKD